MKRRLPLLLLALTLAFTLAACGGGGEHPVQSGGSSAEDRTNGVLDGAAPGDGMPDGLQDAEDGLARSLGRSGTGASYGQMLRNARVHDRDGFLRDHENSVTPGADRF